MFMFVQHYTEIAQLGNRQSIRLDQYIAEVLKVATRSQLKNRLKNVWMNGKSVKLSKAVVQGSCIEFDLLELPETTLEPMAMELDILYEDEDVLVVNKQQGIVVHPACGNTSGTLIQGILHHCQSIAVSFPGEKVRPGLVHRLDKDTSGVLIAAKNPKTHEFLSAQFSARKVKKIYLALVKGCPHPDIGEITAKICRDPYKRKSFTSRLNTGKTALTRYRVIRRWQEASAVVLRPATGRTHQLRVHLQFIGNPILGDPVYSRPCSISQGLPLMLHALSLKIRIPSKKEPMLFRSAVPQRFYLAQKNFTPIITSR